MSQEGSQDPSWGPLFGGPRDPFLGENCPKSAGTSEAPRPRGLQKWVILDPPRGPGTPGPMVPGSQGPRTLPASTAVLYCSTVLQYSTAVQYWPTGLQLSLDDFRCLT